MRFMKENENAPVDLCLEVLRCLDGHGLDNLVLVGSWCTFFYNRYFEGAARLSALRTRDMDFLVRQRQRGKFNVNLVSLLEPLGFLPDYRAEGCVSLSHPALIIDFLVEERGKGSESAVPVPALGLRAQPLRFLNILARDTIVVNYEGIDLCMPHPAAFVLHKLIVSGRRPKPDKALKDLTQALELADALIGLGRAEELRSRFKGMPVGWRKLVLGAVKAAKRPDLENLLAPK